MLLKEHKRQHSEVKFNCGRLHYEEHGLIFAQQFEQGYTNCGFGRPLGRALLNSQLKTMCESPG